MCREKRPGSRGRHQDISLGAGRCSGVFVTQGQQASPPQCGLPRVVGSHVMSVTGDVGWLKWGGEYAGLEVCVSIM